MVQVKRQLGRWLRGMFGVVCVITFSACAIGDTLDERRTTAPISADSPMPPPASNTPRATPIATANPTREPLPPTWTPSHTPTITRTPSPVPTETATATMTFEQFCEGFSVRLGIREGARVRITATTTLSITSRAPGGLVDLVFTNLDTGEDYSSQLPSGVDMVGALPMSALPGLGRYEWTARLVSAAYSEPCLLGGSFTVIAPPASPTPDQQIVAPETTADAVPEVTTEATEAGA